MIDWMNYGKIQEYKRNGLKKSQVARRLNSDLSKLTIDEKFALYRHELEREEKAKEKLKASGVSNPV